MARGGEGKPGRRKIGSTGPVTPAPCADHRPRPTRRGDSTRELFRRSVYTLRAVPARPVHMVRATVCGRARRADAFTADWTACTCPDCALRRPAARSHCLHCHLPVDGRCVHIARFKAWLHGECTDGFERSPLGRHLRQYFPDLLHPPKCPRCGTPGGNHDQGCRGGAR